MLQLKNVKVHDDLSEETTCFTANIYLDGKNIGAAKNDGRGGNTDVYVGNEHNDKLMAHYQESENKYVALGKLESDVDDLLYQWLIADSDKKMLRKQKNCLVFKQVDGAYCTIKYKHPIETILKFQNGVDAIKKAIKEECVNGTILLNTNVPKNLIEN